jgi:hypothetical protein
VKTAAPNRPAVTFTASQEEAGAFLLHLHAEGLCGIADGIVRPRVTVPGVSQERLNSLWDAWTRRCFEERLAAEAREGRRG